MNLSICSKQGSVYGKFHPLSLLCASAFVCLTNTYIYEHTQRAVCPPIYLAVYPAAFYPFIAKRLFVMDPCALPQPLASSFYFLLVYLLWAICQLVCCRSVNNIREFSLLSLQTKITMCMKRWLIELNFRMHFLLATVIT